MSTTLQKARGRGDDGSALVQTVIGTALLFGGVIPLVLQLLVLPVSDLVALLAAQGAAEQLRREPNDPMAAEARARTIVEAFGSDGLLQDVEVNVSSSDGRAVAVVRGHARRVIPAVTIAITSRATGAIEGFRPDDEEQDL